MAGDLHLPAGGGHEKTAVIVQGSLTSVKEQMSAEYARRCADRGFVALTVDYAHYGASSGEPRQLEAPAEKLLDLQAAVTYLLERPDVDSVAMIGVCTSAGNAAYLAADDSRLAAMATVAGMLPEPALFEAQYGPDGCAFPDQASRFHEQLAGPRPLAWLDGNHFDYYDSAPHIDRAVDEIATFLRDVAPN